MKTLDDLEPYLRNKILAEARAYRMLNHPLILNLIKAQGSAMDRAYLKASIPSGSTMYYPDRWGACEWIWFSEHLMKQYYQGGK